MTGKQRFDLHTHHKRCGHAVDDIRDYIEAAIKMELDVIGISDHSPYFHSEKDQLYPHITMKKSEFTTYIDEVLALKREYEGEIDVLLGVESDFFPEYLSYYREAFAQHPFDYIIGSVHYVEGDGIFNKRRWDGLSEATKVQVKDKYYELIALSAQSGLFQILGHIDAMKGFYPAFSQIESSQLEKTLQIIGEEQVAIEVNTSGGTKYCGGWYPSNEILEKALHYNVAITFGSDAHKSERVGEDFDLVKAQLKEIGFKEWCYFKEKQKIIVPF